MTLKFSATALALCLFAIPAAQAHDHEMEGMEGMAMSAHPHDDASFAFGHPGKAKDAKRTVKITMNDLTFTPATVTVKAGETVRFTIHNSSAVDHDFTLGDKPTQEAHRQEMAEAAQAGEEMHHHHDGNAAMVEAGKTATLVWTFAQPGTVEYDCNVPGHFEGGMAGVITVVP
jgi:uncharacterized cupredoxin-like copper-binding protein